MKKVKYLPHVVQSILFIWCYYSIFDDDFVSQMVLIEPYQIFVQLYWMLK